MGRKKNLKTHLNKYSKKHLKKKVDDNPCHTPPDVLKRTREWEKWVFSEAPPGVIKKYTIFNDWGVRYRLKCLARFSKGKVLDVGYVGVPNPFIEDAYGLDLFIPKIKPKNYSKFYVVDADNPYPYPFADNTFDCVIAGETVEHLADMDAFLKEMYRILKPGGVLSLSTPNPESPIEVIIHF